MTTEIEKTPEPEKTLATTDGGQLATRVKGLPAWFPEWARTMAELYFSGTTSIFVLHGNTYDYVQTQGGKDTRFGTLSEFIAEQIFGRWDLVLHHDLSRGLRCMAGSSQDRLRDMVATANRRVGDLAAIPRDPTKTLMVLDRYLQKNVMAKPEDRLSTALVFNHAGYLIPDAPRLSDKDARHLVTLLNWASSPYLKRINIAIVLIESQLAHMSERFTNNPHVATIEVPLPKQVERKRFLEIATANEDVDSFSDYSVPEIAKLTAGISLTDVNVMIQSSLESGQRLDHERFQVLKRRLIERQAQGMLEFIEPSWGLDMVVGHEAAKQRLRDDAELIKRGQLETVPMGYLFCGPVGTGKSFLAMCTAGAIGIPCVKLKNFRSKYVGETEANLERVLGVLRSMGPVVVIVDEADAMLGDRDQGGDSGVGSRVFGMFAQQMGDTRYRGRILWMLLTARPDLLPIDIKRQGRAEVHIPLFYPGNIEELRKMFVILAKKSGAKLSEDNVPQEIPHKGHLSGADVEGIIGRAWRTTLLAGDSEIEMETLQKAVASFIPSHQSLERELQELVAIIECTDREFLPDAKVERLEGLGGRERVQERVTAIKQILEAS
ncbi:MAG: AAA family ATPase [Deltaproteobacteria bacterium]|nr:AAA family ATPase [Deltaproteobacteria bacterium]